MTDIEQRALKLIELLAQAGHDTRFVGGCVRDALLGIPTSDVDLATTAKPDNVIQVLTQAGIKVVPTGIEHGTVTAVIGGKGIEITTLRKDIKTDGRHAVVEFTDNWQDDAARRDFTMNAMSRDASGQIYDYFGGFDDAQAGRIRFVGKPSQRITEDALRILRFFRFYAWYGRQEPEGTTLDALQFAAPMLKQLSRERVWKETKKLLSAPNPSDAWMLMLKYEIVPEFFPQGSNLRTLCNLLSYEHTRMVGRTFNPMLRLCALLHNQKTDAAQMKQCFALSGDESQKLGQFLKNPLAHQGETDAATLSFALYRYGIDLTEEFLVLNMACGAQFNWESARDMLENWQPKTFPITGDDVLAILSDAGIPPGPRVGEVLHAVEAWWVAHNFVPDRSACVKRAKDLIER